MGSYNDGMRGYVLVGCMSFAFACGGGGGKKHVKKPKADTEDAAEAAKPETEEDRAAKRASEAHKIVPEGSSCLPTSLKEEVAPRLELGARGTDALVCAIDAKPNRLLGPVGCWKVNLVSGALTYADLGPLPGRGFAVKLDDRCARGYCLPKEAKVSGDVAHMAWDLDGKTVAVLVGDDVHLFDAESKDHQSSFSIRGDKGVTSNPTNLHFVGEHVVVEAADDGANANVWLFKTDGTQVGQVMALGGKEEKPVSSYKGSVSILDKGRIGVSEHGMETMTTYVLEDGKRAKIVRGGKKPACKPAELDAYWHDGDKVSDKCKGSLEAVSGHLIGATAVAGAKNFLVLYRGDRLGELGVLDAKSLVEAKPSLKMPWCTEGGEGGGADKESADGNSKGGDDKADKKDEKKTKPKTRSADPEEGGE
jgi:hypothetical protein